MKKTAFVAFVIGGLAGVVFALAAEQIDHLTTTDKFCTSCHAMQSYIANAETYKSSAHQTTASGVRASCADCHIPKGLVSATYTHIVRGIGDLWGQVRFDYEDPMVWEAEKARLAYAVRDWLRANDSVTCQSCHEEAAVKEHREHEEIHKTGMTCIDCHYNLVHDEIPARESFLNTAGRGD